MNKVKLFEDFFNEEESITISYQGKTYYIQDPQGKEKVFAFNDKGLKNPAQVDGKTLMLKTADIKDQLKESLNKKKLTLATEKDWNEADKDQKLDMLLGVIKDPDDAEKYVDYKFNNLPSSVILRLTYANESQETIMKNYVKLFEEFIQEGIMPEWTQPNAQVGSIGHAAVENSFGKHQDPTQSMTVFSVGDPVRCINPGKPEYGRIGKIVAFEDVTIRWRENNTDEAVGIDGIEFRSRPQDLEKVIDEAIVIVQPKSQQQSTQIDPGTNQTANDSIQ